jgi:hypothetical protein
VDVFYVQDEWGEKIEEKQKTDHLKQILLIQLTLREEMTPNHQNR